MHSMDNSNVIPAFLIKLWKLVNDTSTNGLIYWSKSGKSFTIKNQMLFSQNLLPMYYKHSNLASFIRQLNMYGFHKVMSIDSGTLRTESDEMEFAHPSFIRGKEDLLGNIRRKMPMFSRSIVHSDSKGMNHLVNEVQGVKKSQDTMESKLFNLKRENELIWREYASMRQQFTKQQKIIQKLVQFLVAFTKMPGNHIAPKRKYTHLALEGSEDATRASTSKSLERGLPPSPLQIEPEKTPSPSGPVIQEITDIEDSSASQLDQVFSNFTAANKINSPNSSSGTMKDRRVVFVPQKGVKGAKEAMPQKYILVNKGSLGLNENSSSSVDYSQLFSNDGSRVRYHGADASPGVQTSIEAQNFPMVESPNGTILDAVSPEEFMTPVNPAEVMPNIVTRTMASSNVLHGFPASKAPAKGKIISNSNFVTQKQPNNALAVPYSHSNASLPSPKPPSQQQILQVDPSTKIAHKKQSPPHRQVVVSMPGGKVMNVKLASVPGSSGGKSTLSKNSTTTDSHVNDVAITNRTFSGSDELQTHVDDVQTSIEALQDMISSSGLNLNSSTLLSLFDLENPYSSDLTVNNGEIIGSELSLYNPPFELQSEAANIPFSQPANSINFKQEKNPEEGEELFTYPAPLSLFEDDSDELNFDLPSLEPAPKKKLLIKKGSSRGKGTSPAGPTSHTEKGLETPQITMSPSYHENMFFLDDSDT